MTLSPATNIGSSLTLDAMITTPVLSPKLYFSYGQFMVYYQNVSLPGCAWTDGHSAQGFARRESVVNFSTPLESGYAEVAVHRGAYVTDHRHERVMAVPSKAISGMVRVEGPDETDVERSLALPPGNYRLVAVQRVMGDGEESIELFFDPLTKALEQRAVLVADKAMNPPRALLETSGIVGEN